jgi:uncharacterized phiE125 gp8 family phage protein
MYPLDYPGYTGGIIATPIEKDYPYFLIEPPSSYPVTLNDVRNHLRIDADNTYENTYLEFVLQSATQFCENYIGFDLINKKYLTFRDYFNCDITLRRAPFPPGRVLNVFQFLQQGEWLDIPTNLYYLEFLKPFSKIKQRNNASFNLHTDNVDQCIKIEFIAGYGIDASFVPVNIKLGILNHIAAIYENRGDADQATDVFAQNFPVQTKIIYDSYKIIETR